MYKVENSQMVPVGSNRFAALSDDYVPMSREKIEEYLGNKFVQETSSSDRRAAKRANENAKIPVAKRAK